jgi:Zn-dependent protease with chaperone function
VDLEAARALVPAWVFPAAVLAHTGAAFIVAFVLGAVLFVLGRRAILRPAPWPIRARALYPFRVAMLAACRGVPIAAGITLALGRGGLLGGGALMIAAAVVAATVPLAFWQWRLTRRIVVAGHGLGDALAGFVTRSLALDASAWAVLLIAVVMPARPGAVAAALLVAGTVLLILIARGGAFAFARALGLAPPAPPEIADPVRAAAERADVRLAGVHQVRLPEANAYAMPFAGRIIFTRAALQKVDLSGLLAIARHEIAHLAEPPRARRVRMACLLALLPVMCVKPIFLGAGLPAAALAVLLALLLRQALRRRLRAMETRADAGAKGAAPEPLVCARAIEELHRLNLVPVGRGATHPDLAGRLAALGAVPTYPVPPAPSRALRLAVGALVGAAIMVQGLWWGEAARAVEDPWLAVALDGGGAWTIAGLAWDRDDAGRHDEAAALYAAASALEPDRPEWPAYRSISLAAAGRIPEAERALAEAERLGVDADLAAEARECIERAR